ncbi:MAG: type II secretion system F family protein [Sterolibacterium sp.]|jgi:type II secretory pathway component PulF|nr:type II secretion system F family protein [Sterolibacterium sp.]
MSAYSRNNLQTAYARFWFQNVDHAARRRLWLKLAKLIGNGVQILQAVESIRDRRIASGGKDDPETYALDAWSAAMKNGSRLSRAMDGWVTVEEMMLISAGEQSGTLESALRSAARVMEARKRISSAVYAGLAYPFVLMLMAIGVLFLFGFRIVPAFTNVMRGAEWHGLAKAMILLSDFARDWLWVAVPVVAALMVVFFTTLSRFDGPVRIWLDRYTPYSIYRIMQGSTWLIALAAMVEAGLRIEIALEQLSDSAGPWLKRRISACLAGMRSGRSMGEALARSGYEFPDREIIEDLGVYSSLSGFEEALAMLGREWLDESINQIEARMKVVFGVSLLCVGALIAFLVSGMMDMELQMSRAMQQLMVQ